MENDSEYNNLLQPEKDFPNKSSIQQMTLKWNNLSYTINNSEKPLKILNNVSGFSNPGEILAIIGPSGCGKTSLLSLLSNSMSPSTKSEVKGRITIDNKQISEIDTKHILKFIPQESILTEFLTPYEYLLFTLNLKTQVSKHEAKNIIEDVLVKLRLTDVKHTRIGDNMTRGISGGERKRVSIASELMMHPSILILDEPTSGLDSFMARTLVAILSDLKTSGINIIFSIHQPSNEIFELFDRLIIMQEGSFVFQGQASESVDFFKKAGFSIPQHINPPDYYMRVLKITDRNRHSEKEQEVLKALNREYERTEPEIWKSLNISATQESSGNILDYHIGFFGEIKWLLWREYQKYKRNSYMYSFKLIQALLFIVIIDTIYFDLGFDNKGVENRKGVIISYLYSCFFGTAVTNTLNISLEKLICCKEMNEGLYSLKAYFIVKFLIELFSMVVLVTLYVFPVYFVVGLNTENYYKVGIFFLVGILVTFGGAAMGILSGCISPSFYVANLVGTVIIDTLLLFSGYFNNPNVTPVYCSWVKYISAFYFLRNEIFKNEFEDLDTNFNVTPSPKDRFGYGGSTSTNILYSVLLIFSYIAIAYFIYAYSLKNSKQTVKKD